MPRNHPLAFERLDYESWKHSMKSVCGRYNPKGADPAAFAGWLHRSELLGIRVLHIGSNAPMIERTMHDVYLDGMDHYAVVSQLDGHSSIHHNGHEFSFAKGDVALIDASRPLQYLSRGSGAQWSIIAIQLPRKSFVSYLGYAPDGGCVRRASIAGRLLLQIAENANGQDQNTWSPAETYMRLVIYDLVGALFAPRKSMPLTLHGDILFKRVCCIIRDRFADPDFGPAEVANEAGISLRYLQKLFTARNTTCGQFIHSVRLDHASRLLRRRALLGASQSIREIAYGSGFRNYTHFARTFRNRFGHAPGVHDEGASNQEFDGS